MLRYYLTQRPVRRYDNPFCSSTSLIIVTFSVSVPNCHALKIRNFSQFPFQMFVVSKFLCETYCLSNCKYDVDDFQLTAHLSSLPMLPLNSHVHVVFDPFASVCMDGLDFQLPYRGKLWWEKTLVNLVI